MDKIVVITDISGMTAPNAAAEVKGVVFTGDPDATAPPVDDTAAHGQADALLNIHSKRQANPPTATANQETPIRSTLDENYHLNAVYAQGIARKVAKAAGDVAAGEAVVERLGLKLKNKRAHGAKSFQADSTIEGQVDITTKSAGEHTTYIREYGITAAKNTPPLPADIKDWLITQVVNASITGIPSTKVIGIREAAVVREHKTTTTVNKAVFSHTADNHYVFSSWIYVTVK